MDAGDSILIVVEDQLSAVDRLTVRGTRRGDVLVNFTN